MKQAGYLAMNNEVALSPPELDLDAPHIKRHRKRRALKDRVAKVTIGAGGMSVIVAISHFLLSAL